MKPITATLLSTTLMMGMAWSTGGLSKGNDGNPATVIIDEQGNDVDVKIDPTANDVDATITNEVEISNDSGAALLIDTGQPARIPFGADLTDGTFDQLINESFPVPAEAWFVVEMVAADLQTGGNGPRAAFMEIVTGGESLNIPLHIHTQPGLSLSGEPLYTINQSMRLYADPGSNVRFVAVAESGETVIGNVTVSGYLVAVDAVRLAP